MENGDGSYRRFLKGDREAFGEIVALYRSGLTYFINRYVNDYAAAEDIAIDTFMYLLVNPKKYNFSSSLKTYLYTIGRSRALDYLKRRKKQNIVSLNDNIKIKIYEASLEEQIITTELHKKLKRAINALPQDMQLLIHLIYFDELSYKEAAAVLKSTPKKVDNLLYRAKNLLKNELKEELQNEKR